ncbi:type I toxin-antitoxin system SymE family toxin [Pseudomonas sp. SK3(2021)]|uniref:SymE family type I addiction module toxin n=1 Tax=Pseudomonas sp. SK3(2021) TaxID=2841064 RepID=UPI00192C81BD|nr:SymE family type I addiction module toxin [Pseudomonas sp. SK3(2021)]QQZ42327.1 type I toxin-antitoxin system SymE family toxin [Pseudomonas sp. SK3(2021)]
MAKADHRATLPKTERFATIAADFYPPLDDAEYPRHRRVPWLRLRGHWLQQAGFAVNQKIRIQVSKNRLVITAE